jgi:plastocyanin
MGKNSTNLLIGLLIIIVAGLVVFLVMNLGDNDEEAANDLDEAIEEIDDATNGAEGTRPGGTGDDSLDTDTSNINEVTLSMTDYEFSPDTFTASPGQTVRVILVGMQGVHDFRIDELGVNSALVQDGDQSFAEFTIPETATLGTVYDFYCSVDGHRQLGMEGTLSII